MLGACNTKTKTKQADEPTQLENATSDSLTDAGNNRPLETVAAIQDAYAHTMEQLKNGSLDSTFFDYDCQGERSGRVVYFSNGGNLVFIKHSYGEYSHHEVDEHYFVQDNKPFFQFRKATSWTFEDGAAEGATKDDVVEQRVYLKNEKPFRCLQKTYVMRSKASDNPIPDKLPNKDINCGSATSTWTSFRLLAQYQKQRPTGCLKE